MSYQFSWQQSGSNFLLNGFANGMVQPEAGTRGAGALGMA